MTKLNLANKKIVVVGMGLTGLSCVRFLKAKGAKVTAMDSRSELALKLDVPLFLGPFDGSRLNKADLIVLSPGIDLHLPVIQNAIQSGVQVIGDIELFAQFNETPVIAITGSNGKSTVTHLVVEMCKAAGKKVLMGGNIGIPVLDLLEKPADIIVLEISSFQLETTYSLAPLAATVLNISEDHLDRHGDLEAYQTIKLSIYQHAKNIVCNRDDILSYPINSKPALTFGTSNSSNGFSWDKQHNRILLNQLAYLDAQSCLLVGDHNMLNIQAAAALAKVTGIEDEYIKQGAREFGGLPHRCQTVSLVKDIRWINDSKATNVGATLAAIKGLMSDVKGQLILIAGGEGKEADFTPLNECIGESVDALITLGKDGKQIRSAKSASYSVTSIQQAVQQAAKLANSGDIVLLSPACASLDMFVSYQQRGDCFANAVKELAK
ncbi:MAG: UDP-N-acetylmuramoyl-L-alanine--D-glutamate ligase [Paraglaciecola sp.]|uniref:UDP-N-acetylmuramoyl-L-alanine--D-glutamate ligase n=1 Tax=Paraglaciecola sp. TaxID=1920173 RepID=UPI003265F3DF